MRSVRPNVHSGPLPTHPPLQAQKGFYNMISIILGIIMIVGGLSGKLVFIGTNSGGLLAVVGVLVAGRGIYRIMNRQ
jgi:hypothetical protein